MIVYRLEHKDTGEGPYCIKYDYSDAEFKKETQERLGQDHGARVNNDRPAISDFDLNGIKIPEWHFACQSEKLLKQWFRGHLRRLYRAGFVIRYYELKNLEGKNYRIGKSNKQLIFHKDAIIRTDGKLKPKNALTMPLNKMLSYIK